MRLDVTIDPQSGFCGGVIRAIKKAEDFLKMICYYLKLHYFGDSNLFEKFVLV